MVFAVPTLDVHSPCRLHRREKLEALSLQSSSRFLDIEILAKGTFLSHLLDEVPVPRLKGIEPDRMGAPSRQRRSAGRPLIVLPAHAAQVGRGRTGSCRAASRFRTSPA